MSKAYKDYEDEYAVLFQQQGTWSNGEPFGNYAVFVNNHAAGKFWQQVSDWYMYKKSALNYAKRKGIVLSFVTDF